MGIYGEIMRSLSFNARFINEAGDDLVPGKMHTIRKNFPFWKKFEGQDVVLFTWEGKPYRSKQRVFCVKKLVNVQKVRHAGQGNFFDENERYVSTKQLAVNDGFKTEDNFIRWFLDYPSGEMALLHFTDFRY
jgi:hypothetical protein